MMNKEGVYDIAQLALLKCDSNDSGCFGEKHSGIFANMTSTASTLPSEYSIDGETEKSPFKWDNVPYVFSTKDGVSYGVSPDSSLKSFSVYVDMNGITGPNVIGTDMKKFSIAGNAHVADITNDMLNLCSIDNLAKCDTTEKLLALEAQGTPIINHINIDNEPLQQYLKCYDGSQKAVFSPRFGGQISTYTGNGMELMYDFYCR